MADNRALEILFDTYWSPAGWRSERRTGAADLAYAKQAGVMFEPATLGHDAIVNRAVAACRSLSREQVAEAFLGSLGSRRLDARSALGSWALLQRFEPHGYAPSRPAERGSRCAYCGFNEEQEVDFSVLNFERHKWGGVRHDHVEFAAFDLELFARSGDLPRPTRDDRAALRRILEVAGSCGPGDTASTLVQRLTKARTPTGTKDERSTLVDILGLCGVLVVADRPAFTKRFTPWLRRDVPAKRFVERRYPVCWWQGPGGVDRSAATALFGSL